MQEEAETKYREALEGNDSEATYHDKLAVVLAKQGKLEEALQENIAAIALAEVTGADAMALAQYHFNKGVTLERIGDRYEDNNFCYAYYNSAEFEYKDAISLDPENLEYYYGFLSVREKLQSLVPPPGSAGPGNPDNPSEPPIIGNSPEEIKSNAAKVYISRGNYIKAIERIEEAIHWNPSIAEYHYTRAALLIYFNRKNEAIKEFRVAYILGGLEVPEEWAAAPSSASL